MVYCAGHKLIRADLTYRSNVVSVLPVVDGVIAAVVELVVSTM